MGPGRMANRERGLDLTAIPTDRLCLACLVGGEMKEIPKEQILRRIGFENPWWTPPNKVPGTFTRLTPRPYLKLFYPLVFSSTVRRAPILMGPRRVGKTYLLHHCIACLLEDGIPPNHICYISVDS